MYGRLIVKLKSILLPKTIPSYVTVKENAQLSLSSSISCRTEIGEWTIINKPIFISGSGKCSIGKYCAFGANIKIQVVNHKLDVLNMNNAFQDFIGAEKFIDNKKNVIIGHSVWIGDNVVILPGVRIGNGAVIAAGAIVTKDVPEFAIYGGNPAQLIRYRFKEKTIEKINKLQWWDWDIKKILENKKLFNSNIEDVIDEYKNI